MFTFFHSDSKLFSHELLPLSYRLFPKKTRRNFLSLLIHFSKIFKCHTTRLCSKSSQMHLVMPELFWWNVWHGIWKRSIYISGARIQKNVKKNWKPFSVDFMCLAIDLKLNAHKFASNICMVITKNGLSDIFRI